MNILFAEDDEQLGRLVTHMLGEVGYKVEWIKDGDEIKSFYNELSAFDILILDWMMPNKSGIEICQEVRNKGYQGGILILTAKDSKDDRIMGLDIGADDYVIKPFDFDELFARIRALKRRSTRLVANPIIENRWFLLDCQNHIVILKSDNKEVQLSPREFQLLKILSVNQGNLVTRELIMNKVWGIRSDVTDNTIDATIKLLRKKIACKPNNKIIHTIRGVGYKLGE